MRRLRSLAWRSLGARKLRTFLTTAGIALGVAVLFASLSAGATVDSAVDKAAADEIGRADLRVSALEEGGLTKATLQSISQISGVSVAAPALERKTYLAAGLNQTATAQLPPPVTVLGIDPVQEPKLHDMPLMGGHLLADGDIHSALITQTLSDQERLFVGDTVSLSGTREVGPQAYTIVGIVAGNGTLPEADGRLVIVPLQAAQTLFGVDGVTRVDLGAARGTTVDELTGQLEQGLRTQPYLLFRAADLADTLRSEMADFRGALLLVAAVVLFAGAFLIFNTLSMTVAELTREVGLLRAAGTTRSQVMGLILLQALALGVAGSVVGVAAGIGFASVALSSVRSSGPVAFAGPAFSVASVAVTFFVGIILTLAAALEPAWRAGRIPPVEALRRGPPGAAAGAARLRWLVLVFAVLAVGALVFWPSGGGGSDSGLLNGAGGSGTWGPLVVFGILQGTVLLVPRLLGPLVRIGGIPFRIFRNEERLARSSLTRDRSRTALTAGALVVGVAMIVALGTAAQDVRKIGASWLTETIPGSELLTSIRPVATTDPIRTELAAKPGVKSVSPIGLFPVGYLMTSQVDGRSSVSIVRQEAAAIVGADYLADGRLSFVEGDRTAALTALGSGGSVIVPESVAGPAGIHLSDTLEFATGSTVTKLRCVGIVQRSIPAQSQEAMLVGWSDAAKFGVTGADFFAVRYQAGMEATARTAVDTDALSYALEPNQLDRVSGTVGDALDRIFRLLDALALIAVLVAGLGMVNTFSMSVLERVREIGVLRATGMTSGQVWGMVVIEAGILGIVGSAIGSAVGLVVGILLVGWSSGGFAFAFDPPWLSIALAFCFGILVSVIAAIYPAGLASRFSIVRALQHE